MNSSKISRAPLGPLDARAGRILERSKVANKGALLLYQQLKAKGLPVGKLHDGKTYLRRAKKSVAAMVK